MPKTIDELLDPSVLDKIERAWCELVTDQWIERHPPSSQHHHEAKGFTRDHLLYLARVARRGEDGLRHDESARASLSKAHVFEFGYTVSFLYYVREKLAPALGYRKSKGSGLLEREVVTDGRYRVDAEFFSFLETSPFVAPEFKLWCARKNIATGHTEFSRFLEATGRYVVKSGGAKDGGKLSVKKSKGDIFGRFPEQVK